jgi:broad specificity phosphatase PhoE
MTKTRNGNPPESSLKFLSNSTNEGNIKSEIDLVDLDDRALVVERNVKSSESLENSEGDSLEEDDNYDEDEDAITTYIIYLIRHGEARHNVLEKEAQRKALARAVAEGHALDSAYTMERMEEARKSVLSNDDLFDAPLSAIGKQEAAKASRIFHGEFLETHNLPSPKEVLVSPLQRTLQTADVMFPQDTCGSGGTTTCKIRVREELRERCTGQPPDNRKSSAVLSFCPLYKRFSMERLRRYSFDAKDPTSGMQSSDVASPTSTPSSTSTMSSTTPSEDETTKTTWGCNTSAPTLAEDKEALRVRTNKLWGLLAESKERVIAIVTHKGYLRELERGPLDQPHATEFANGEVRAYQVTIDRERQVLLESERLV